MLDRRLSKLKHTFFEALFYCREKKKQRKIKQRVFSKLEQTLDVSRMLRQ